MHKHTGEKKLACCHAIQTRTRKKEAWLHYSSKAVYSPQGFIQQIVYLVLCLVINANQLVVGKTLVCRMMGFLPCHVTAEERRNASKFIYGVR